MPSSPSSSAQSARRRLGARLRALREAARTPEGSRVTGRRFAELAGWSSPSLVSMIENGNRTISSDHVRLWCEICGATERRTAELLAEQANVAGMWLTWKQVNRAGLSATQRAAHGQYENVRLFRSYMANALNSLIQTEDYMTVALTAVRLDQGLDVDDVSEAVAERLGRKDTLRRPDARWLFLLEGQVLWHRVMPVDVHRGQLHHLLDLVTHPSRRPTVSLGIIPAAGDRTRDGVHGVWPEESFTMFDSERVTIELISGYLSITQPDEIAAYVTAWDRLFGRAVHGERAAAQIRAALTDLDGA
ncbi:Scr1 family TA system antitoxin-like transcriptional regulator [Actinocorallia longicatena]|uniref:Helix-turn-helix transcriptional regulator n=1 Tax=Actinocorallia longicatena TaxID=111803 RepID=A0ABP6QEJ9_9ACTN